MVRKSIWTSSIHVNITLTTVWKPSNIRIESRINKIHAVESQKLENLAKEVVIINQHLKRLIRAWYALYYRICLIFLWFLLIFPILSRLYTSRSSQTSMWITTNSILVISQHRVDGIMKFMMRWKARSHGQILYSHHEAWNSLCKLWQTHFQRTSEKVKYLVSIWLV